MVEYIILKTASTKITQINWGERLFWKKLVFKENICVKG